MPALTPFECGPPADEAEIRQLAAILDQSFLRGQEQTERWTARASKDTVRVVRRGSRLAGGLTVLRTGQFFGGRSVPCAGVAAVGIAPDLRSSGAATALLRSVLEELHADGVALSVLFPATVPVYRRAGYELAGAHPRHVLPVGAIGVRDRSLEIRPATEADRPAMRRAYTERARRTAGNFDRSDALWERVFEEQGGEAPYAYVVGEGRRLEGYVVFSQRREGRWRYDLVVRDLVWLTPQAGRRLLTFFAGHRSLADELRFVGAPADPLLLLVPEREARTEGFPWMARVVDVPAALRARGWPPGLEAELHLEVRDDVLPPNDGRWVVEITGGHASVRRGGRGRIRIDVRGLAALYTGYLSAGELRSAGYLEGPEGDERLATAAFSGPSPWLADFI